MRPRLAFVDHSFHKKTQSSQFFLHILQESFDVTVFWDEAWQGGKHVTAAELNAGGFQRVFFWQCISPLAELKRIDAPMVWAPMFDTAFWRSRAFWLTMSAMPVKIVSFSRALTARAAPADMPVLELQYFLNPAELPQVKRQSGNRVFFWERSGIRFSDVKRLIGGQPVEKLYLKRDPDPGHDLRPLTREDELTYNIEVIEGHLSREQYFATLRDCNVFVAPRKIEGIGMSFIEAMTLGMAVIALDRPTMNEYLTDGYSGYVIARFREEVSFEDKHTIAGNALIVCQRGYEQWCQDAKGIVDFVAGDTPISRHLSRPMMAYLWLARYRDELARRVLRRLVKRILRLS